MGNPPVIGVFDSGVGGLSVLREIRDVLPEADLLYVADRARAPYGTRALSEVEAISVEVAGWMLRRGADCLVVACNTASAAALETLRQTYRQVPIVGMEPAVKPAAAFSQTGKVAVLATAATFQGRLFESVVDRFASGVRVITRACPEWVQLVESGEVGGAQARAMVRSVVEPLVDDDVDVIVLACTHFSFLTPLIAEVGRVAVIDPAPAVAAQTARVVSSIKGEARLTMAASGEIDVFAGLARSLAGIEAPVIPFRP
jgi:glutamate racemase